MSTASMAVAALVWIGLGMAQEHVTFPAQDGWLIYGNLYGQGSRGVVLVHGGRFTKESWDKQAQELVHAGYRVLAIDQRGFGESKGSADAKPTDAGRTLDVLAAMRYLRKAGAATVSLIGGSMGGDAAGEASADAKPGEIDGVILLGSAGGDRPEKMTARKLYITARNDLGPGAVPRLREIQDRFKRAPEPKELVILDGSAHAQFLFASDQGARLMSEILRFLAAK